MIGRLRASSYYHAFASAAGLLALGLVLLLNGVAVDPAFNQLMDFGSFVASSREAIAGNNPYASDSELVFQVQSRDSGATLPSPNLNPPISLLFFAPLANANPLQAANGWRIASVILFVAAILMLGRAYPKAVSIVRVFWSLSLAGIWHTIALGQIYVPLLLLTITVWLLLEQGQDMLAGMVLGLLIAIKPNFVIWLGVIALSGNILATISAMISGLLLTILPIFVYGPTVYAEWLAALSAYPSSGLLIAGNSSLQSLVARLGYPQFGLLVSLMVPGFLWWRWLRGGRKEFLQHRWDALGIVGSLLLSPFSWVGYTIMTLPVFLSQEKWNWRLRLAACILAVPYLIVLFWFQESSFHSVIFGWLYGWGLLLILWDVLVQNRPVAVPMNGLPTCV